MVCDIARKLDDTQIDEIQRLERELGLTIVAFACRSMDAKREERLLKAQAEMGPILQARPAHTTEEQLAGIRRTEEAMGLALVAVE